MIDLKGHRAAAPFRSDSALGAFPGSSDLREGAAQVLGLSTVPAVVLHEYVLCAQGRGGARPVSLVCLTQEVAGVEARLCDPLLQPDALGRVVRPVQSSEYGRQRM
ncbi:hypothetical protein [Streptomyces sp. PKU-MA01144]|uniref:hypothetical protein n=1 Tax=Streptomyces sp. PKU-MA01144 TaxID=2729138 RepID=UPI00279597DC|nr:hypothetical protein [Streptomyces sp. PKU-MA01144]